MIRKKYIIVAFLFISLFATAQEYTSKSKKAIKHFNNAIIYYNSKNDLQAIEEINLALKADSEFIEAYLLLSNIYNEKKDYEKEIEAYNNAIRINPDYSPNTYYYIANAELLTGRYHDAEAHFKTCLSYDNISEKITRWSEENLVKCEFAINAIDNPVPFNPKNLGANINTEYDEYWPSLTADEQTLIITVLIPKKQQINIAGPWNFQEDFFISHKIDGQWSKVVNIGPPVNTQQNEGAQTISADGQYCFFSACDRTDGFGRCDIYMSEKTGDEWSKPVNIGKPVNSAAWESQPSISSDGKTLYFVSNCSGGKGKMDIWKSMLNEEGKWGEPVNLGDSINTSKNEMSPFIHTDNKTLYFASDGLIGMGGCDLFVSRKILAYPSDSLKISEWQTPVNLGYPINTYKDEIGLIVNARGNLAMFSSDRLSKQGKDIYEFDLYEQARPVKVNYVKGKVFDADTKKRLKAKFELIDLETAKLVVESHSNSINGEYLVCLPIDKNYALNVSKKGYLFYSENFSLKNLDDPSRPYLMDVPLLPIKVGEKVVLKNIFFETDSYELKLESKAELEKLIYYMKENPGIKVEISGHTDNVGSKEHNKRLSHNRAKSVFEYLTQDFPSLTERLTYKGYDYSEPIATNDTEEGRAKNRRTEFKIIGITIKN